MFNTIENSYHSLLILPIPSCRLGQVFCPTFVRIERRVALSPSTRSYSPHPFYTYFFFRLSIFVSLILYRLEFRSIHHIERYEGGAPGHAWRWNYSAFARRKMEDVRTSEIDFRHLCSHRSSNYNKLPRCNYKYLPCSVESTWNLLVVVIFLSFSFGWDKKVTVSEEANNPGISLDLVVLGGLSSSRRGRRRDACVAWRIHRRRSHDSRIRHRHRSFKLYIAAARRRGRQYWSHLLSQTAGESMPKLSKFYILFYFFMFSP